MLNLYYDSENKSFSYIQHGDEEPLLELFFMAAEAIAILASKGDGNLEESYDNYLFKLAEIGSRDDMVSFLESILASNVDQIFLNGETKEEAARHMAYSFKEMMPEEAQEFCGYYDMTPEEFQEIIKDNFIDSVKEIYNVDVTSVFESSYDFEDDLF